MAIKIDCWALAMLSSSLRCSKALAYGYDCSQATVETDRSCSCLLPFEIFGHTLHLASSPTFGTVAAEDVRTFQSKRPFSVTRHHVARISHNKNVRDCCQSSGLEPSRPVKRSKSPQSVSDCLGQQFAGLAPAAKSRSSPPAPVHQHGPACVHNGTNLFLQS